VPKAIGNAKKNTQGATAIAKRMESLLPPKFSTNAHDESEVEKIQVNAMTIVGRRFFIIILPCEYFDGQKFLEAPE